MRAVPPFVGTYRQTMRRRICLACVAWLIGLCDRRSVQPTAARDEAVGYDLPHHFVASGICDAAPLEAELPADADRQVGSDDDWSTIDEMALPQMGCGSAGIAPQYVAALGQNAHCQTLVSLTPTRCEVPAMADLRLFASNSWRSLMAALSGSGAVPTPATLPCQLAGDHNLTDTTFAILPF
jgi:hypothetical protein